MKDAVVLFPSLGIGNLTPMVELAKLLTRHHLSATIVLVESPFPTPPTTESFIARVCSAHPLISFHRLPKPEIPPPSSSSSSMMTRIFEFFRQSNPLLLEFLQTLSQTSNVRALVLGLFCTTALDVADELRLPTYFFFAGAASSLAAYLYTPTLQSRLKSDFKDIGDEPLQIPGLPPIPASHMPDQLQDSGSEVNRVMIFHFERLPKGDGIVVNSFEELEPRAVQALVDGVCVPGQETPPVYCVGPLITETGQGEEKHECLKWLDCQPNGSVVFVCFGSFGSLSARQVREIAVGLERSGQRFLWVVRSPPSDDPAKRFEPRPEPDLGVLLPEGFLERTEGRGMVVKSWAPQAAALGHGSVGGFVSHSGWNSILEAVTAGVPIVSWPLYAEQKMNKVLLVEEAKLAVAVEGYDKELVNAEEVEAKVRWLMESEGGRELRDRAAAMKERAVAARKDGGSSEKAWKDLMDVLQISK